jgi:CheY-like chemotaxis protein
LVGSVLLVEDEESIRTPLRELLEIEGLTVWTANDGAEAINFLRRGTFPHVILLDLRMPNMDGNGFLIARRANPYWRAIPVVLMSAWLHEGALVQGADFVMAKPLDSGRLLDILGKYCAGTSVSSFKKARISS